MYLGKSEPNQLASIVYTNKLITSLLVLDGRASITSCLRFLSKISLAPFLDGIRHQKVVDSGFIIIY